MDAKGEPHPMDEASFISRVTLWWIFETLRTGYARPLEHEDLSHVRDDDRANRQTKRLYEKWEDEKKRAKLAKRRPLFWWALLRFLSWKDYCPILVTGILRISGQNIATCCIIKMIYVLSDKMDAETFRREAAVVAYGLVFGLLVREIAMHHFHLSCSLPAIRVRAATLGLIYKKVLSLPHEVINPGLVMELISDDSQKLVTCSEWLLPDAVVNILESLSMFGWLVYFVGWQAVVGSLLYVVIGLFRTLLVKVDYRLRKDASHLADQRLGHLREIIAGIRSIKLNTWEEVLEEKVRNVRRQEVIKRMKILSIIAVFSFINFFGKSVVTFVSILLLLFTSDGMLTGQMILTLLLCTAVVDNSWGVYVPTNITLTTNVATSLKRIQSFLEIDELSALTSDARITRNETDYGIVTTGVLSKSIINQSRSYSQTSANCHFINLKGVTCELPKRLEANSPTIQLLSCVNLYISQPGLTIVVGPVGSGKSSLLTCVLGGELVVSTGIVKRSGKLAYVSQTPWVFPGTIRENITFGLPYNEDWYLKTIEVCELKRDIAMFPDADMSLIGEHGSTVSGGQRTRIVLARAVYSQADIYLLDDPLSALDAKVADNVFHRCLRGLLADRIVILATHHLRYLKEADYVVKLDRGVVIAQGDVSSMMDQFSGLSVKEDEEISSTKDPETTGREMDEEVNGNEATGKVLRQEEEDRETGSVRLTVYWEYFRNGAPAVFLIIIIILFFFGQALVVVVDVTSIRLSHFATEEATFHKMMTLYSSTLVLACLVLSLAVGSFYFFNINSSRVLHNKMVQCVLKAPLLFHSANPVGRIMNRFSQDIGNLDDFLPVCSFQCVMISLRIMATLIFVGINNLMLIPFAVLLLVVFVLVARFYCRSAMDLKRIMSIACGPLYSHFSNTMDGIKSIRVYQRKKRFINSLYSLIDAHDETLFAYYPAVRWFALILDISTLFFLTIVLLTIVLTATTSSNAALLALGIIYVCSLADVAQYGVRMFAETHSIMTSAERALAYTKVESEKGHDIPSGPPKGWPSEGKIYFRDVSLRYYEDGPKALQNLTFEVNGSEKIGIAGRTGAGKSSLVTALMRLSESDGEINIDGVNLKELNVRQLRNSISVISQSPVLLRGPLRESLDPHGEFTDSEIWDALDHMQIKSAISVLPNQLDTIVVGRGSKFSVGERQLLHLARVLLQKSKILVFDEATANVDLTTDEMIQRIIRSEFKKCTVITIAHRLTTILDCDRVMLLDRGKIVEYDEPDVLLEKEEGSFKNVYEMSK